MVSLTDRILDAETIELRLGEAAPDLGLIHLICIIETSPKAEDMLHQNAHGKDVFIALLVYCEHLFVQAMLSNYARDFQAVVVLQFGNVAVDLCFVGSNGTQHEGFSLSLKGDE